MATEIVENTSVVEHDIGPSQISWGAVIAGLVFVVSISWLMFVLGSAIGVGIADATDMEAMGEGLGTGAVVWILLTSLIAYFLGAMLVGRLAGNADKTAGMLNGVTLWSVATVLTLVLGYAGVSGLINSAQNLASGAARVGSAVGAEMADGAQAVGNDLQAMADSPLATELQAMLKKRAASLAAEAAGPGVSQQELTTAAEQIDTTTLQTAATDLLSGDPRAARQTLADNTTLTAEQIDQLVQGINQELPRLTADQSDAGGGILNRLQNRLSQGAAELIADADAAGGPQLRQQEVRRAIDQLTPEVLRRVGQQMLLGNTDAAKNTLVVNTDLSEQEIDEVVDGVSAEVEQQINEYRQQINAGLETASDYTQAVLWALFISSALGLAAAIFGGGIGADTVRNLSVVTKRNVVSTR